MLPLAHIYVATKVSQKKTPLLVFGSVLPDISWISQSKIGRDKIHYAPRKLYEYISENFPHLVDLAVGVRLHSNVDKGADYYSDGEGYSGFAYVEGAKIEPQVADLLGGKSNLASKVLSHNFIEAGTDLALLEDKPDVLPLYSQSIDELNLSDISMCLGKYLDLNPKNIKSEIDQFLQFAGPDSYISEMTLAEKMTLLIKVGKGFDVNSEKVSKILSDAKKLMKEKYEKYLTEVIDNMKHDFSDLVSE